QSVLSHCHPHPLPTRRSSDLLLHAGRGPHLRADARAREVLSDSTAGPRVFLETERLVLREFTPHDVEHLVELDADPEVMRYISRSEEHTSELQSRVDLVCRRL